MDLVEECVFRIGVRAPMTTLGDRVIAEITGGTITGERLSGRVLGGGDWMTVTPDGFGEVDVRFHAELADGSPLYVHYTGLLEMTSRARAAVAGHAPSDWPDHYFRTHVRMESARHNWVNTTLFVGEGRLDPGPQVVYRIHRLT